MPIQKLFTSRSNRTTGPTYVGERGKIFYDEDIGQLRLSNGSTPGGLPILVASTTANLGNLYVAGSTISTVNVNEDLNLNSNNLGNVNIIGKLRILTSAGYYATTPVLSADAVGNVIVNGNLLVNGGSYFTGNVVHYGRTRFNGDVDQVGNLTINGTAINNGISEFNGNITIAGNAALVGNTTVSGTTFVTGNTNVTGNTTVGGNTFVTGFTTVTGNTLVTGNTNVIGTTYLTGNSYVTGNTTVTGTTYVIGNTYVTGQTTTITGNTFLQGNSYVVGNTFVTGPTTVTGNITITGNSTQTGQSIFVISQQNSTRSAMEITGDTNGAWQTPVNTGVMLQVTGQASLPSRIYNDSIGTYAVITGRRMEGSIASPTGVQGNIDLIRYSGAPYTTAGWANIGPARITVTTNEIQTGTNQGGRIEFWTTANSAGPAYSTISRTATIDPALGVTATGFVTGGTVTAGNIAVSASGTLTTPRVVINDGGIRTIGGGTTCTIDFAVDSLILWTAPSGTAAITLSNYTAGAKVKLIIALTTSRDITYGISAAANSSTGADNWNGAGGGAVDISNTAVQLEYTCFSGVAGGCYVAVTAN